MITPDRGHQFGGYYRRDAVDQPDLCFGIKWLNAYDCGAYVTDETGIAQGVSYIIMQVDEFPDCFGRFAESFDLSCDDADYFCQSPVFQAAAAGIAVKATDLQALPWLPPSVQYLLMMDLQEGLEPMEIFERRAAVLTYRFLGFTFEEMITHNPKLWQPTIDPETGAEIPNLSRCSLEDKA